MPPVLGSDMDLRIKIGSDLRVARIGSETPQPRRVVPGIEPLQTPSNGLPQPVSSPSRGKVRVEDGRDILRLHFRVKRGRATGRRHLDQRLFIGKPDTADTLDTDRDADGIHMRMQGGFDGLRPAGHTARPHADANIPERFTRRHGILPARTSRATFPLQEIRQHTAHIFGGGVAIDHAVDLHHGGQCAAA